MPPAKNPVRAGHVLLSALMTLPAGIAAQTTVNVLSKAPQFGIYESSMPPYYSPPPGQTVLKGDQAWYTLTRLSAAQKQQLGADLAARVTKHAGCDSFDRIESVVYLAQPPGVAPTVRDLPRAIEMMRFMTSFSTFNRDAAPSPYVFPLMDLSLYAPLLANPAKDIWVGFGGTANPDFPNAERTYNPCWDKDGKQVPGLPLAPYPTDLTPSQRQTIFAYTGFLFSLDLVSTKPSPRASSATAAAAVMGTPQSSLSAKTLKIPGTITVRATDSRKATVRGTLSLIVTSHGTDSEYGFNTENTLSVNGRQIGEKFSTQADCQAYANADINPLNRYIDGNTNGLHPSNPRNWCPAAPVRTTKANPGVPNPPAGGIGTPVQSQIFRDVTLRVGPNQVILHMGPFVTAAGGVYGAANDDVYRVSLVFIPDTAGVFVQKEN
jgi:hypothetical protein